ncbi:MAG: S8 family serine peptidase [Cyclobacteriaceae bacterium]
MRYEPASIQENKALLGFALEQIEAEKFIELGLNGAGVKVGIIDGGFLKANKDKSLSHFFENELVKSYKDYITPDMEEYGGAAGLDDNHGTEVWQLIGGLNRDKNIQFGLATAAEYYLARTDHGAYEKRIEEDYLIQAMEDMEKEGVKLINISLGYNVGFKSPEANYKVSQMDGKTTKLAKAVDYAALNKGMLIVVAAGNDAKTKWKIIDTPADAKYALTVGASKFKIWDKMSYSSIGPDFTDFVKPDISVYSTLGTSYSTPVVTGMAACLWQLKPELTNFEMMEIFKRAGNFYPYPNNYLGYGVPTASSLLKVIQGDSIPKLEPISTNKSIHKISVDEGLNYIVGFHKKDGYKVIKRLVYRPKNNKIKVKKVEGSTQSSILLGQEALEIFWQ